jgi:hypothetical protein
LFVLSVAVAKKRNGFGFVVPAGIAAMRDTQL